MVASWKEFQGIREDDKNLIQHQPKWWRAGKDCRNSKLSLEIGNEEQSRQRKCRRKS